MTSLATPDRSFGRGASWLAMSTAAVGVANYVYAISLTWLLPARIYSMFAGGQALLLLVGTVATASVPWVVAQGIAQAPWDVDARRHLLAFAGRMAGCQGLIAAAAVAIIAGQFADSPVRLVLALAAFAFFLSTVAVGYLQGLERFGFLAGLRVGEVIVKFAVGVPLALAGLSAAGALAGFGVGALAVLLGGLPLMRGDLGHGWTGLRFRAPWRRAAWLAALQAGVALFANLDVLLPTILAGASAELARYQVSATLGRVPLFFALALATVVFPRLSAGSTDAVEVLRTAGDFFVRTAVPVAVVIGTMPDSLVRRVFPSEYAGASGLLPYTAAAGITISVMYLLTAAYQAEQRFRTGASLLGMALAIQGVSVAVGFALGGVRGLAAGTLLGSAAALLTVFLHSARVWTGGFRLRRAAALGVAWSGVLVVFERDLLVWSVCAVIALAGAGWTLLQPHLDGRQLRHRYEGSP